MFKAAHAYLSASELHREGTRLKFVVGEVCSHTGHPLHDVQWTVAGVQTKIGTFGELHRVGGVVGELLGREVTHADMLGPNFLEDAGKSREVLRRWIGNDVEILSGACEAVHADGDSSDD